MPSVHESMSPEERSMRGRIAASSRWARASAEDRAAAGRTARRGFDARFEREVDPDGTLSVEERFRRAEHAKKAYMLRLALASSKARRKRA